ncbi:MAG: DUF2085 domain-containing protein [Candidatus Sigynarchaeota archaeon]
MASKQTGAFTDFTAWNLAFMLLYFLNAINIALDFNNPFSRAGAVALMGVQSGLVVLLAFTRKPVTALISAMVPVCCFYVYAFTTGITNSMGLWIPGISVGVPAFHVIFSVLGSMLVRWIKPRCMDTARPASIPGLEILPGINDKADTRRMMVSCLKLATIAAIASVIYCIGFLLAWIGDAAMRANALASLPVMAGMNFGLVAAFIASPRAPRVIYNAVLTHHVIEDADHAIGIKLGKSTIFLCTRCTAMLSGLFFSMYTFATLRLRIDQFMAFFLDIFIPAPVFIDWGLQRFGFRKATTRSRIITGALTGLGFALVPLASPGYAMHAAIVLMSYFAIFFLIYFLSARRGYYYKADAEPVEG